MKRITATRRIAQWKLLLERTKNQPLPKHNENHNDEQEEDPFDCSELIIPSTKQLIKDTLQKHMQEWQELDSRIVVQDNIVEGWQGTGPGHQNRKRRVQYDSDGNTNDNDGGDGDGDGDGDDGGDDNNANNDSNDNNGDDDHDANGHESDIEVDGEDISPAAGDYGGITWGYHANRIRLPDFFDYTSKGPPPQQAPQLSASSTTTPTSSSTKRRQVISLQDPTQKLDYEVELWKIFQKVPLEHDIEIQATQGAICCTNMLELKKEIQEGYKEYTRLDGHALTRLRKKDRHHWPRTQIRNDGAKGGNENDIDCATVKLELWRRQVKRFGTDPNKCEMEFLSTQTLQDVHNVIVECSEDELFCKGMKTTARSTVTAAGAANPTSSSSTQISPSSGYFFIDDTFYSTGDVDYVTPVMNWLNEDLNGPRKKKNKQCRKTYLKIDPTVELKHKRMQDVKLGDVVMRLGLRYVHVSNGDCETAVFFTDVSMRMKNENIKKSEYPLLHDVWTTATSSLVHGVAVCEGCDHCPAVVLTLEDEMGDGGPTPLCATCYGKLHYDTDKDGSQLRYNNFKVVPMSILQNLRVLSVGHDHKDSLF